MIKIKISCRTTAYPITDKICTDHKLVAKTAASKILQEITT